MYRPFVARSRATIGLRGSRKGGAAMSALNWRQRGFPVRPLIFGSPLAVRGVGL